MDTYEKTKGKKRAEEASARTEAEVEGKLTEPEKIFKNVHQSQEIEKLESTKTFKPNTILAQIPRYAYLLAIFALFAGVFFPLITPGVSFDHVIQGTATLFLGLVGAILLFKAATSDQRRGIFIAVGFALITISLVLIYHILEEFSSLYS
uniref:Uncharacterized protein n=1 Tax=uncultured marine thaumarchaeote KM3_68_E02 TaxID=1456243 RepID=A0A075HI52_9ARCH|nr:hypothetical protein [uncultured marine thaumarchaeote KM3_68_E02]